MLKTKPPKERKIPKSGLTRKVPKANPIKTPTFKSKKHLSYMHNSSKCCLVCGDRNIELHHVKTETLTDRDDSRVVPLCPEHHRGKFSAHGFEKDKFYEQYPKDFLLEKASDFFKEFLAYGWE